MRRTDLLNIFVSALAFIGFSGCSSKSSDNAGQASALEIDSAEYVKLIKEPNDTMFSLNVDYKFVAPKPGVSEAGDKIYMELTKVATQRRSLDFEASAKAMADSLYKVYRVDALEMEEKQEYSDELQIGMFYSDSNIYVASNFVYSYSGGAHGYHCSNFYVFNASKGCQYELSDFFSEESKSKLSEMIVDYFVKENKVTKASDLLDVGFLNLDDIKVTENFHVDKDGIGFVYCPYSIACYASGTQTASFKWKEVAHLLKPNSPVSHLTE